jgi:hypothetical protein
VSGAVHEWELHFRPGPGVEKRTGLKEFKDGSMIPLQTSDHMSDHLPQTRVMTNERQPAVG